MSRRPWRSGRQGTGRSWWPRLCPSGPAPSKTTRSVRTHRPAGRGRDEERRMEIAGSGALITGGASGLGAATARRLAAGGARVTIFDMNGDKGTALAAELGGGAQFHQGDVTKEADTQEAVETATSGGSLNIVVACAGGAKGGGRTVDRNGVPHSLELFQDTVDMNLVGTFNTDRLAAAAMAGNDEGEDGERGIIISTASIAGYEGQIGQVAYAAAKGGIIGMTI